jgi:rare lipoprotein A
LALVLLCVGAALIVAGLVQSPEPGARPLPRSAQLPPEPSQTSNSEKKAARERGPVEARLASETPAPKPEAATPAPDPLRLGAEPRAPQAEEDRLPETGRASWYDLSTKTASGEDMDGDQLTAAHPTLPLGARVRVENLDNGRAVVVRINDRGPFAKDRIIDLSKAAAEQLGMIEDGVAKVRVSPLAGEVASNAKSGDALR